MRPPIDYRLLAVILAAAPAAPAGIEAQGRDVDLLYGRWYRGNQSSTYEVRTLTPLGGAFGHGLTGHVLLHDALGRRRAFYGAGWELQALRHRRTVGLYGLAGAALGLSTDTTRQALAALWSIGAGVEWRPISWFALGLEGRYRLQDIGPRGFWRSSANRRDGVGAAITASLGVGKRAWRGGRAVASRPPPPPPPPDVPRVISGNAADIVRTALAALGTPYLWGGTAANGFDCSGLVQWAYSQHGIRVPRMSRDQAQAGSTVTPLTDALNPGDILLFATQPGGGVSHVGLYVGGAEGAFIHSSNTGVKLSRLDARDPDGAWWVARWVGARRVIE